MAPPAGRLLLRLPTHPTATSRPCRSLASKIAPAWLPRAELQSEVVGRLRVYAAGGQQFRLGNDPHAGSIFCYRSKLQLRVLSQLLPRLQSHARNDLLMQLNSQCLDREPTLAHMFTEEERFCVAVAALAHDLGHSGTNNHF